MSPNRNTRAKTYAAITALAILAAVLRFHAISAQPLWLDEAYSAKAAAKPIAEAVRYDRSHPPLYYAALHFWAKLGDDEGTLRAFSALCSVAALPFVYAAGATLARTSVGILAAALYALASFQVRYAQEARMYALFTLAACVAMWGLARILRDAAGGLDIDSESRAASAFRSALDSERTAWIAYVFGTTLMLWTQHTGWLFVIAANVCVLILTASEALRTQPLLRKWMIAQLTVFALWLPALSWLVRSVRGVADGFWIPPVTLERVLAVVESVYLSPYVESLGPVPGLVLFGAAALGLWASRARLVQLVFCATLIGVPLAAEVASQLWRPILLDRTLIWTAVPFELLVATGVLSLRSLPVRATAVAIVLLVLGADVAGYYEKERKEAWDEAAAHVAARANDDDLIVFVAFWIDAPFDYYFRRYGRRIDRFKVLGTVTEDQLKELAGRADAGRNVWLVCAHAEYQDPGGRIAELLRARCEERNVVALYGVDVLVFARCGAEDS